jgi:hypothetical protein
MKHSFFLATIFSFGMLFSQSGIRIKKGFRSLRQQSLFIECTVLETPVLHTHFFSNNYDYYWFQAQRILCTQGGASGQLLHGGYEAFYDSKQLAEKGKFRKGLKDGVWKYWDTWGHLERVERWRNGKKNGKQLYYDGKGSVHYSFNYKRRKIVKETADSLLIYNRYMELLRLKYRDEKGSWNRVRQVKPSNEIEPLSQKKETD